MIVSSLIRSASLTDLFEGLYMGCAVVLAAYTLLDEMMCLCHAMFIDDYYY